MNTSYLKRLMKNDVFKTVLITLLTVLLTQSLSYFFWTRQFLNTKSQTLLNYKIESLENFTRQAGKHMHLSEYSTRIFINRVKIERQIMDSISIKKGIVVNSLSSEERKPIEYLLKDKFPEIYIKHTEFLDNQNEFFAAYATAFNLFQENVKSDLFNFQKLLAQKRIIDTLASILNKGSQTIFEVDEDQIAKNFLNEENKCFNELIRKMQEEIKK